MTFLLKDYCQKNDSRAADVPDLIEAISEVATQQLPSKTVVRHEDAGPLGIGVISTVPVCARKTRQLSSGVRGVCRNRLRIDPARRPAAMSNSKCSSDRLGPEASWQ